MSVSFRSSRMRESWFASVRQITNVRSVYALSDITSSKFKYVWARIESIVCWMLSSPFRTGDRS